MGALVAHFGADAVIRSLLAIGWGGFAAICLIHLVLIAVMGIAWRALVPGVPAWVLIWGRLTRDAGSEVLPLSPMGGCILGARAVTVAGVPGPVATASTIVDLTLEFFAKLAYTALGLALLLHLRPASAIALPITAGIAVATLVAIAFVVVQHHGFDIFDRFARALGRGWADRTAAGAASVHNELRRTYRRRAGLWSSFLLHLACWVAGALEVWIALRLAGAALDFAVVLGIESLLYAIRTVAFAIPNAVGVQEGAYILLGGAFGLTPEMALSLSLLKRARDLAIGLPALGLWQAIEGSRLWRRLAPRPVALPVIYMVRHGETAWSRSGQHTGRTDLPLTESGERNARALGERLRGLSFAKVLTSPSQRAVKTCELAGFAGAAEPDPDLAEWDYGRYEGRRTAEILAERPDWRLFRDGCPGGESPAEIGARADRVVSRVRAVPGNILVFSSAHILRVLAARWLGLEPAGGRHFLLGTASLSVLGYEHNLAEPAIRLWNDTHHLERL
jgi:putative membrane protein